MLPLAAWVKLSALLPSPQFTFRAHGPAWPAWVKEPTVKDLPVPSTPVWSAASDRSGGALAALPTSSCSMESSKVTLRPAYRALLISNSVPTPFSELMVVTTLPDGCNRRSGTVAASSCTNTATPLRKVESLTS